MPLIQVILFDDQIISETPKLLKVNLAVDGVPYDKALQGIINVVDNVEELSNKIRLELPAQRGVSFKALQEDYRLLLERLRQGKEVEINLSHRTLKTKKVIFSLKGLDALLKPNQSVCF